MQGHNKTPLMLPTLFLIYSNLLLTLLHILKRCHLLNCSLVDTLEGTHSHTHISRALIHYDANAFKSTVRGLKMTNETSTDIDSAGATLTTGGSLASILTLSIMSGSNEIPLCLCECNWALCSLTHPSVFCGDPNYNLQGSSDCWWPSNLILTSEANKKHNMVYVRACAWA